MIKCITDKPATIKKLKRHCKAFMLMLAIVTLLGFLIKASIVAPELTAAIFCAFAILIGIVGLYVFIYGLFTE